MRALLARLESGDIIIVSIFEHFVANFLDSVADTEMLREKKVRLIALDFPISLEESISELFLDVLIEIGKYRKARKKIKTRRGIDHAKKEKKYKGRKPLLTDDAKKTIIDKYENGGHSISKIAEDMEISRNTIYNFFTLHRNPNPSKKFIFDIKKDVFEKAAEKIKV